MSEPAFSPSPHPAGDRQKDLIVEDGIEDQKPLSPARKPGFFSRARILGPVGKEHGDLALLACCLVTGMVDAASFMNWEVFVAMQTGNTVILGLSTAGNPSNPYGWLTTMVSLASFLLGAFFLFRASNYLCPKGPSSNRLWAGTIFFPQGLLILIAAALATPSGLIPQDPAPMGRHQDKPEEIVHNILIVALLPPLAFQSGMQIASSRLMGFNELPVNVLTSTYCDLMGDFKLFALNNVKRNRRVAAAVLLLIGSICSGWLMRSPGGLESVLWVAAGIKILVGVSMWCFLPAAEDI
ncbi:hypothetical protein M409DRAFT_65710 [Zasmidium cellare ATCC 36951]|uniref:DUF1275 domain protein n=1 Tax=Zasmidium cellare ATCC 36951 TaxID=1080233 RepID=A0A6A6CLY1_ZASCE|nr:uncharacterized protein M409DRAFT_65710 [Zasmidium cellare ATCC 36951]KAF2168237.1 hypothetical protein M409DRAFT_65710 [Zasmidium cellare ATCC 36951]